MTRKEQKEERRKAILMTALKLFVERGYHDTKITDIAEAVPMSTGLRMGSAGPGSVACPEDVPPDVYLTSLLGQILSYAKEQPWVFYMFVLMGQVRRTGMPEEARKLAESADALVPTVSMIERGQKEGIFHKGDSDTLARCFWYAVQGIMEQMATDPEMKAPDPEWIVAMLK